MSLSVRSLKGIGWLIDSIEDWPDDELHQEFAEIRAEVARELAALEAPRTLEGEAAKMDLTDVLRHVAPPPESGVQDGI